MNKKWFNRMLKPAASLVVCGSFILLGGCNDEKPASTNERGSQPNRGGESSTTDRGATNRSGTEQGQETTFRPEHRAGEARPSTTPSAGDTQKSDTTNADTSATPTSNQRSQNAKGNENPQATSYKAGAAEDTKAGGDQQAAQTVRMMDNPSRFEPAKITISEGQSVEWRNEGKDRHTVTMDPQQAKNKDNVTMPEGAAPFDSGAVEAGSNYKHTFTKPGTYKYFCRMHEQDGMVGEITVTPKGGAQQQ